MKDKNLTVEVIDDVLSISIGTDILLHACEIGRMYGLGDIVITDEKVFIEGIVHQLESENEDGSTLIHKAFDEAVTEMLENGELGVDELEDV